MKSSRQLMITRLFPWYHHRLGVVVAILLTGAASLSGWADDPDNCLLCHQYRGLGRYLAEEDALHLYFTSSHYQHGRLGAHARIACTDCHERSEVNVIPHQPVSPVDCTRQCHLSNVSGVARKFSHTNVAAMLDISIHNRKVLAELEFADGPLLREGQSLCLYCHDEPLYRDPAGVMPIVDRMGGHLYDRCNVCHEEQIPTDTAFYLRHIASRVQHSRSPFEMAQACAVCHCDPKIRARYEMQDGVVRYTSTFHGKAALLGSANTADCIDCHGERGVNAHLIRSQKDPLSSTHPDRKAESCRSSNCHPGADINIGQASAHLNLTALSGLEIFLAIGFVIFTLLTFGPSLVITLLELFQLLIGRHHRGEEEERALTVAVLRNAEGRRRLIRFTPAQRVQHWILVVLFAALVVTGFPMKFASHLWSRWVIEGLGGLGVTRAIHHWAGIALVVGFAIHLLYCIWTLLGNMRRIGPDGRRPGPIRATLSLPMFVGFVDLKKFAQLLAYIALSAQGAADVWAFQHRPEIRVSGCFLGHGIAGYHGDAAVGRAIQLALYQWTHLQSRADCTYV